LGSTKTIPGVEHGSEEESEEAEGGEEDRKHQAADGSRLVACERLEGVARWFCVALSKAGTLVGAGLFVFSERWSEVERWRNGAFGSSDDRAWALSDTARISVCKMSDRR
jgi:hypothetical protein